MPRYLALDSLRGIAALAVAAYHIKGGGALFNNQLVQNAWLMVDFFFVLSGFVIAANYAARLVGDGFPTSRFLFVRLGRLYPLHMFVLAAYLLLEFAPLVLPLDGHLLRQPFGEGHSPLQLLQAALLLNGFDPDAAHGWSGQSWSIAVEMWLYLAMAALWFLFGLRGWIAALGCALAAFIVLHSGYDGQQVPLTTGLLRGIAGFGLGVVCWQAMQYRPARQARYATATIIEFIALAGAVAVLCWSGASSWQFLIADLTFAAVVLAFAAEDGAITRLLTRAPFVLLGTLSYSIYLVHPMVIGRGVDFLRVCGLGQLAPEALSSVRMIAAPAPFDALIGLALLGVTVAVAWLTWRFVEQPARQWSRRYAQRIGNRCK